MDEKATLDMPKDDPMMFRAGSSEWEYMVLDLQTVIVIDNGDPDPMGSFKFLPDSLPSPTTRLKALKDVEPTAEFSEYSIGSYLVNDSGDIVGHKVSKIKDGEVVEVTLKPIDR